jgi:capsular polysaccharide biosynthesis protein
MRDLSEFPAHLRKLWWLVAVQALFAVVVVSVVLALVGASYTERTSQLVLHPGSDLPATDVPAAVDGLRPDGSLVQTVLHVLGSNEMLSNALTLARVQDPSKYSLDATVEPGSAFFDQTVRGPDAKALQSVSTNLTALDTAYIKKAFSAYNLDAVGISTSTHDPFPPTPAVALLALLLGAAFAIAIIFAEWWVNEPKRSAVGLDVASASDEEYDALYRELRHAVAVVGDPAPPEAGAERSAATATHDD